MTGRWMPWSLKVLVDGEQARLEDQDVVAGLGRQQIDAAGDERLDLRGVGCHEVIEGDRTAVRRLAAWLDVESLGRRSDACRPEAGRSGVAARELIRGAAGDLGGRLVDLADMLLQANSSAPAAWR